VKVAEILYSRAAAIPEDQALEDQAPEDQAPEDQPQEIPEYPIHSNRPLRSAAATDIYPIMFHPFIHTYSLTNYLKIMHSLNFHLQNFL
jgi:hypothetical protein